jgi:predicted nucleic acid-binding protein
VRSEPESTALALALEVGRHDLVSSSLLVIEAQRAARRYGDSALQRARAGATALTLIPIDGATLDLASRLDPPDLRSLDAIHLATALSIADDLDAFYTYDHRLADAAASAGLAVAAPV